MALFSPEPNVRMDSKDTGIHRLKGATSGQNKLWQRRGGRWVFPHCGSGIIESYPQVTITEQCDDGNYKSGDGCSSECTVEDGWRCHGGWVDGQCDPSCDGASDKCGNWGNWSTKHTTCNCESSFCYKGWCYSGHVDEQCNGIDDFDLYAEDQQTQYCLGGTASVLYQCDLSGDNEPSSVCGIYCDDGVHGCPGGQFCKFDVGAAGSCEGCHANCSDPMHGLTAKGKADCQVQCRQIGSGSGPGSGCTVCNQNWDSLTLANAGSSEADGDYVYDGTLGEWHQQAWMGCVIKGCFPCHCPNAGCAKWLLYCNDVLMYSQHTNGKVDVPPSGTWESSADHPNLVNGPTGAAPAPIVTDFQTHDAGGSGPDGGGHGGSGSYCDIDNSCSQGDCVNCASYFCNYNNGASGVCEDCPAFLADCTDPGVSNTGRDDCYDRCFSHCGYNTPCPSGDYDSYCNVEHFRCDKCPLNGCSDLTDGETKDNCESQCSSSGA